MKPKNQSPLFPKNFDDKYLTDFLKNFSTTHNAPIPSSGYCETDLEGKILSITFELLKVLRLQEFSVIGNRLANFCFKDESLTGSISFKALVNDEFTNRTFNLFLKNSSDEFLPCNININKRFATDDEQNRYCFIFTNIDKVKKKSIETQQNSQKDAILQAIIFACESIIQSAENISDVLILDILRHLGIATRSNRVIIYENRLNNYRSNIVSLKYEWCSPKLFTIKENSALNRYKFPKEIFAKLSSGASYQNRVDNLFETDSLLLKDHLIKSFILLPIFSKNKFWGILSLADCEKPRHWSHDEQDGLLASTRLIGQIINKITNDNKIPKKYIKNLNQTYANPICVIDKNARIIFKSTGFQNFMGFSSAQTSNLPLTAFIKSETDDFFKIFEKSLLSPIPIKNIKVKIKTSDEQWQPVTIDLAKIDSSDSKNPLLQVSIQSIDSYKTPNNTNDYFSDSNYKLILDKIPYPIWITNKDSRFIYGNDSFYDNFMTGINDKSLILGKRADELSEKLGFLINLITSDISKNRETKIEKEVFKNNSKYIFKIQHKQIFINKDDYLGQLWFAFDETKHKITEQKLEDTNTKYKTILDNIPGAVFIKDSKGKYIYANSLMKENCNFLETPICRETIFSKDLLSKVTMQDLKILREGKIKTTESFQDHNNQSKIFEKHKFKVPINSNETLICGISIDITKQLEANKKIEKLKKEIEYNNENYLNQLKNYRHKVTKKVRSLEDRIRSQKYRLLRYFKFFYKSPLIFFWCNTSGKIISVNYSYKRLSGFKLGILKENNIDSILDSETKQNFHEIRKKVIDKEIDSGELSGNIKVEGNTKIVSDFYISLVEDKNEKTPPRIILIAIPKK